MQKLKSDRWVLLACWHHHEWCYGKWWSKAVITCIKDCVAKCGGKNLLCAHQGEKMEELDRELWTISNERVRCFLSRELNMVQRVIYQIDILVGISHRWEKVSSKRYSSIPYWSEDAYKIHQLLKQINWVLFPMFSKKARILEWKKRLVFTWLIQEMQDLLSKIILRIERRLIEEQKKTL